MKRLLNIFLICATVFLGSGCVTVKNPLETEIDTAKIIRYMEPASYFACKNILENIADPQDRRDKAKIIFQVAKAIRELASGNVPTPSDIETTVNNVTPFKKHWLQLATEMSMVYDRFYENVTSSQRAALMFESLGELAEGCERAAKTYLTPLELANYYEKYIKPFNTGRALIKPLADRNYND